MTHVNMHYMFVVMCMHMHMYMCTHTSCTAFRRHMAHMPDAWDWTAAHVPSGLSEEQEEEKQEREAVKAKEKKKKAEKARKERWRGEEGARQRAAEALQAAVGGADADALQVSPWPAQCSAARIPAACRPQTCMCARTSERAHAVRPLVVTLPGHACAGEPTRGRGVRLCHGDGGAGTGAAGGTARGKGGAAPHR